MISGFRQVYTNLSRQFFTDKKNIPDVFRFHHEMVEAIDKKDSVQSEEIMRQMLDHGEKHLKEIIGNERRSP